MRHPMSSLLRVMKQTLRAKPLGRQSHGCSLRPVNGTASPRPSSALSLHALRLPGWTDKVRILGNAEHSLPSSTGEWVACSPVRACGKCARKCTTAPSPFCDRTFRSWRTACCRTCRGIKTWQSASSETFHPAKHWEGTCFCGPLHGTLRGLGSVTATSQALVWSIGTEHFSTAMVEGSPSACRPNSGASMRHSRGPTLRPN